MVNYKNYKVWSKSHDLVLKIYRCTKKFPPEERYNLTSQINRAAVSIPTNIAEGCGRDTQKDFLRFLHISSGSAFELEYLILLSADLNFLSEEDFKELSKEIEEVKKMLFALINKIKAELIA